MRPAKTLDARATFGAGAIAVHATATGGTTLLSDRTVARADAGGRLTRVSGNPQRAAKLADAVRRFDSETARGVAFKAAATEFVTALCLATGADMPSPAAPLYVELREEGLLDPTIVRIDAPSTRDRLVLGTDVATIANESVSQTCNRLMKTQNMPYAQALSRAAALHGAKGT